MSKKYATFYAVIDTILAIMTTIVLVVGTDPNFIETLNKTPLIVLFIGLLMMVMFYEFYNNNKNTFEIREKANNPITMKDIIFKYILLIGIFFIIALVVTILCVF